jgi:hypothetical protein
MIPTAFSGPAGSITVLIEADALWCLPAHVVHLADRLGVGDGYREHNIGAACLQRYDLRLDGRIAGLVGLGGYDHPNETLRPVQVPLQAGFCGARDLFIANGERTPATEHRLNAHQAASAS